MGSVQLRIGQSPKIACWSCRYPQSIPCPDTNHFTWSWDDRVIEAERNFDQFVFGSPALVGPSFLICAVFSLLLEQSNSLVTGYYS